MHGFSEDDHPVALGHVLGLRWFQLTLAGPGGQPLLRGSRGDWQPGVNKAVCLREAHLMAVPSMAAREHRVPVRRCGCGFWAYWHLGAQMADEPHIAGLVKGYGNTIKGPAGFRCQTAEIMALVPLADPDRQDPAVTLALEAVYGVEVFSTIEALLEMHKAPPTQPPLADDYFCKAREAAAQKGSGDERGRRFGESNVDYARRLGLLPDAPCMTCGFRVCRTGQALCVTCQTARAYDQMAATARKATLGMDALNQLHARREGWAKDAPSILDGPGYTCGGQPAEHLMKTQDGTGGLRFALEYIKAKFGDGSWWRSRQHPDA